MRTILPMRTTSLLVLVRILAIAIIVGLAGIDWTGRLAISAQAQDQQKKEALKAAIQIAGPRVFLYNYNKLINPKDKDKERIILPVRNVATVDLELAVSIKMVDAGGKDGELIFRMVDRKDGGGFEDVDAVKIGSGKPKELAFELLPSPNPPKPGNYKGEIKLTPASTKHSPLTVPFVLVVNPNIEIVESSQNYDYLDLVSTGRESLVPVTLRNKGDSALSVKATIAGQENILPAEGKPVRLTFQRVLPGEKGSVVGQGERPVEIGPGHTVTIYFKLQDPGLRPAPGTYKAFLVVAADNGSSIEPTNQLSIYVPSQDQVGAKSYIKAVKAWLLQWPRRWSMSLLGRKLDLDALDWAFVFVVLAYLIRRTVLYSHRRRLGTINIKEITNATDLKDSEIKGLEALLKDTLEKLGLSPPSPQPVSSISTDIGDIIVKSAIPAGGFFKAGKDILTFIQGILCPAIGHEVSLTLKKHAIGYEVIVEIKDARTAKTEEIHGNLVADNAEGAIRRAAHSIYWHAINQPQVLNRTPEWSRFRKLEGFESYQAGKSKQKAAEAIADYRKAADCEVGNALIRLSLGAALGDTDGDTDQFLEAMIVYLKVVTRWPEMIEPRYRLAVTFSYNEQFLKDIKKLEPGQKKALLELLREYANQKASTRELLDKITTPEAVDYLKLAKGEWDYLIEALQWGKCFNKWLATLNPATWRPDIRSYLWSFSQVWPWGLNRRQYQKAVKMASYCAEVQEAGGKVKNALKKVSEVFSSRLPPRWTGMDWTVRYNGACAYSRALASRSPGDKDYETWSQEGVRLLERVIRDPESASIKDWLITGDPDLKGLRESKVFTLWKDKLGLHECKSEPLNSKQQPQDSLAQGWELLSAGAGVRRKCWAEHQKILLLWPTGLDARHLSKVQAWYQREADIWAVVVALAMSNGESRYHKPFWDELMQDRGQEEEKSLPPLSEKIDDAQVMKYKDRWHQLVKHARELQDAWDRKEDGIRSAITDAHKPQPARDIGNAIEAAMETWHALELWARHPLNEAAEEVFLKAKEKKHR